MWSWLGKAASGVAGALGGPLVSLLAYVAERVGEDALKAASGWFDERAMNAKIQAMKKEITATYQAELLSAVTPEQKEAAYAKYQTALGNLAHQP